jgi:hypothetical protein
MDIDPAQPWGVALDYYGRATVTDSGHTVVIRVYDQTLGSPLAPDPITGQYPAVYVSAQIREYGTGDAVLQGFGDVIVNPAGTDPVPPDQTSVPAAVAKAVADFRDRADRYTALCAQWAPPQDTDPSGGDATGTAPVSTDPSGG